ncbi:hypothetical protein SCEN_E02370 [Saccharomyces cerevisiae]|nr:hypothetical protein SCEN_E02370 [Saccharomyces cerevisiae]
MLLYLLPFILCHSFSYYVISSCISGAIIFGDYFSISMTSSYTVRDNIIVI